jgi:4-hydroxy-tetrahydrodipicolinate synthase
VRFRSHPSALRGAYTALVTPFAEDESLDLAGLRSLCRWRPANGEQLCECFPSTGTGQVVVDFGLDP